MLWPGERPERVIGQIMRTGFDEGPRGAGDRRRTRRSRRVDAPPDAETYVPHAQWPLPGLVYGSRRVLTRGLVPLFGASWSARSGVASAAVRTFQEVVNTATLVAAVFGAHWPVWRAGRTPRDPGSGVMSHGRATHARARIRSALGASNGGLLQLVLREGFADAIGIVIGLVGAPSAARLGTALLYQVSPTDPLVLTVTAAGLAPPRSDIPPRAPRLARRAGDRVARGVTSRRDRQWPLTRIRRRYCTDDRRCLVS